MKSRKNYIRNTVFHLDEKTDPARLVFTGPLLHSTLGGIWKPACGALKHSKSASVVIDTEQVPECDSTGIGLLARLLDIAEKKGQQAEILHLKPEYDSLLKQFRQEPKKEEISPPPRIGPIESLGKLVYLFFDDLYAQVSFFGQTLSTGCTLLLHPKRFRRQDFWAITEQAGVRGIEIIALLGFLFGLIMAFSSAMPLRQFGVEVYVSDLVALALVRVLGPFITAIIVAGRTGSAFAAEIGTMKVNNEIDALKVMNLDPVSFLVIPRVLATTLVTPLLSTIANIMGLIGSGLVILSLGYPPVVYLSHVHSILSIPDVLVGLTKAVVYGALVGMIGCMRGLQTELGAGAVGIATTRAVVTAIILLVVTEGIFSVLLYYLNI